MRQVTVDIGVGGMSCASCVASLEAALRRVPGVAHVSVNLATERATINYDADVTNVPAMINTQGLQEMIEDLGYEVPEITGPTADVEQKARELEMAALERKFVVGAVLSALVIVGSMPELVPWWPAILTNHLTLWALTTPVQFWVGWQFLRGFGAVRLISPSNDGLYISP
jgi:Cu+-exporting ATPase